MMYCKYNCGMFVGLLMPSQCDSALFIVEVVYLDIMYTIKRNPLR